MQVQVRDRVHMRVRADVHVLGRLSVRMCVHMYDTVVIPHALYAQYLLAREGGGGSESHVPSLSTVSACAEVLCLQFDRVVECIGCSLTLSLSLSLSLGRAPV